MRICGPTENSIDLWWRAPEEPNGEIGYYLHYWRSVSGNSTRTTLTLPKSVQIKTITDLKAYTNYTFAVVAYNLRKKLSGAPCFGRGMTKAAGMKRPSSHCGNFSMSVVISMYLIFNCSNCSYICCTLSYSWLIEKSNIPFIF